MVPCDWEFLALSYDAVAHQLHLYQGTSPVSVPCVAHLPADDLDLGALSVDGLDAGWEIRGVVLAAGCVQRFVDLAVLGCEVPECFNVLGEFLGGAEDADVFLEKGAFWGQMRCVRMRKGGGVRVPAVGFLNGDFSLALWMKREERDAEGVLFSDWREWERSFFLAVRRGRLVGGVCLEGGVTVTAEGDLGEDGDWEKVGMSWEAKSGTLKVYNCGKLIGEGGGEGGTVRKTERWWHDVGLRVEGWGNGFSGHVKLLQIVCGAVPLF